MPSVTTAAIPVSFSELQTAVADVAASGQVGEPVNVRLHWDIEDASIELPDAISAAAALAAAALHLTETRWIVRRDTQNRLLNVLGVDDRGRTTLLSVSRSAIDRLSLTVFGNHGVARIEQAQPVGEFPSQAGAEPRWATALKSAMLAGHD